MSPSLSLAIVGNVSDVTYLTDMGDGLCEARVSKELWEM